MHAVTRMGILMIISALATACQQGPEETVMPMNDAMSASLGKGGAMAGARHFVSPMDPGQEVHTVVSNATGNAVFQRTQDGLGLHYRVIVAGATDMTQGHIHLGPAGTNGPVVAFLFNFAPLNASAGRTENGVVAEGTLTAASLVGPMAGQSLEALLEALRSGDAYVNVHTVSFPAGEVRGQIRPAGPPHAH